MFCPSCGSFVQDGSLACSNCGSEMPVEDSTVNTSDNNSADYANNSGNYNNYNGGPYGNGNSLNHRMAPEKSNKRLIIATISGIIALIVTAIFCSALIKNSSGKCDGTYKYSELYEGQNCTLEIVISKGKFEYKMTAPVNLPVAEGSIDITGNIVTFKSDDIDTFSGTYNKAKKTLTFEGDTSADTMVFKKSS